MASKKVTLDVAVKTEEERLDALDKKLEDTKRKADELRQQKIQMKFDADTQALDAATQKVKQAESNLSQLKAMQLHWNFDVDDSQIQAAEQELEQLKQEQINLQLKVEEYKLDELQSKKDAIEADEINVQLNNQSAMQGLEQIADGFSRIKNSAMEVGQEFGNLLASAGKQETNFAFLKNAVGDAELAKQKMQEINDIVAQLPGDDTALQGLLSSAAAQDSSLTAENLRSMANSATDYFSAMSYYGKSAAEAQQDMTNYLLTGNTAELERSPILQGHIDKLKEATTVQERSKALAEALNEEHWGGMGAMDTYNNKLETFNGMIERGRYTLGGMFQEGAKGAMDFLLKLDESTNGLVGMTIAAGSFLSPVTEAVMGLGQMATGFKALKDAADLTGISDKLSGIKDKLSAVKDAIKNVDLSGKFTTLKQGLTSIATSAKNAAVNIGTTLWGALKSAATAAKEAALAAADLGKKVLLAGYNALKAAGMWLIEKARLIASTVAKGAATVASYALAVAEWLAASPILLVVAAVVALVAILWYLYNTNESVRNAINGFIAALRGLGETIYGYLVGAFEWLQGAWQNTVDFFTNGGTAISEAVTGAFTWISDTITGVFGGAVAWLQGAWQNTVDFFTSGGQSLWDTITGVFTGVYDIIVLSLTGAFEWITTTWQGIIDFFTEGGQILWDTLTAVFTGVYDTIMSTLGGAFQWLMDTWTMVVNAFMTYAPLIVQALFVMATGGLGAVVLLVANMSGMPNQVGAILQSVISRVVSWVSNLVSQFTSGAQRAVSGFLSPLSGLVEAVSAELSAVYSAVMSFIQPLIDAFNALGSAASWAFSVLGMGQGSPGNIYRAVKNELEWTTSFVEDDKTSLVPAMSQLGASVSDSFKPNLDSIQSIDNINNMETIATVSNAGDNDSRQIVYNLSFNLYGDMDKEERMKEFLEYVKEYLNWENTTAGRTV